MAVAVVGPVSVGNIVHPRERATAKVHMGAADATVNDIDVYSPSGPRIGVTVIQRERALIHSIQSPRFHRRLDVAAGDQSVRLDVADVRIAPEALNRSSGESCGITFQRLAVGKVKRSSVAPDLAGCLGCNIGDIVLQNHDVAIGNGDFGLAGEVLKYRLRTERVRRSGVVATDARRSYGKTGADHTGVSHVASGRAGMTV